MFKSNSTIIVFVIFSFLINGCNSINKADSRLNYDYENFQNISIYNEFELRIPNYFKATDNVDPQAILEFEYIEESSNLEVYLTVTELEKAQFDDQIGKSTEISLQDLDRHFGVNLNEKLKKYHKIKVLPKTDLINGFTSINNTFKGQMEGVDLFYHMILFEYEKYFYQILIWGNANFEKENNDMFSAISHSFIKL